LATILPSRLQDLGLDYDYWPVTMNRRFQFRLRTLMIVVTLVALCCPFVVWAIKGSRDKRHVVEPGECSGMQRDWSTFDPSPFSKRNKQGGLQK
jgi:hypothetical protein